MATTYTITVQSTAEGNKYFIDGVQQDSLTLQAGESYIFDQSDASNTGHPLALSETDNGTHGGGSEYIYNITKIGTAGTDGLLYFSPDNETTTSLYYYCQVHSGMGGSISVSPQTQIDPQVNFFKSTLVGTYSATDTSFTIATGDGEKLPDPSVDGEYNLTVFEGLQVTNSTTFEIVRVIDRTGDSLTVNRGIEGTSASSIGSATHSILMSATKKVFSDIDTQIENVEAYDQTLNTTSDVAFNSVDVSNKFLLPIRSEFPASPSQGEMFFHSTSQKMVLFDGQAFQQINTDFLVQLGLATAQVTANGITLAVDIDFITATATTSANDATTQFLSGASRSLELAEATSSGLDATMEFLLVPFTAWATTSSMLEATQQMGGAGDKDGALYFGGNSGGDSGDNFTRTWDGSSWSATSSIPVSGHQLGVQHIGSKNDTMFTNRYIGNGNYPGNTYQWNGSSWASTTSSPSSGGRMMSFGITSDAIFHRNGLGQGYFYNGSSFSTTSSLPTDMSPIAFSGPDSSEGISSGQNLSYVWNGSSWATTSAYPYDYNNGVGSSQGTNSIIATGGSVGFANPRSDSALWNGTTWATTSSANVQHYFGNGVGDTESTTIVFGSGYYNKTNTTEVTV